MTKYNTKEDEKLYDLIQSGDRKSLEIMLDRHKGLVIQSAEYYAKRNKETDIDDLIQEGYLGLISCLNKFDYSKGYAFSTYGRYYIRGWMHKYIQKSHTRGATGVGRTVIDRYFSGDRDGEAIKMYINRCVNVFSLHQIDSVNYLGDIYSDRTGSIYLSHGHKIVDYGICDISIPSVCADECEIIPLTEEWEEIKQVIMSDVITDKERYIIGMRFGILDSDEMSVPVIAEYLDIDVKDVINTVNRVIRKVRKALDVGQEVEE